MTEEQQMITCCKCHGKGTYDVPQYWCGDEFELHGENWETHKCEVCHGTGKITLEFYEELQRGCRR